MLPLKTVATAAASVAVRRLRAVLPPTIVATVAANVEERKLRRLVASPREIVAVNVEARKLKHAARTLRKAVVPAAVNVVVRKPRNPRRVTKAT